MIGYMWVYVGTVGYKEGINWESRGINWNQGGINWVNTTT